VSESELSELELELSEEELLDSPSSTSASLPSFFTISAID
jgi:hypothetical protein